MKRWKRDQKVLETELTALKSFFEARFGEIKSELKRLVEIYTGTSPAPSPVEPGVPEPVAAPEPVAQVSPKPIAKPRAKAKKRAAPRARPAPSADSLSVALQAHPKGTELALAGKLRDQLLRSLVPLYLARELAGVEVNSGAISAFWKAQGVSFAGPNAAKALRAHPEHITKKGKGWTIAPSGVAYVEAALNKREAA